MAIIKVGQIPVASAGSAYNLNLGFFPSYMKLTNYTKLAAQTGVVFSEWYSYMANGYSMQATVTAGVPTWSVATSNGFTPFQTGDAALFVPSRLTITGISKAANAVITAVNSFTAADVGVTTVTFSQVVGMTQINTLRGVVVATGGGTAFTVNINTTGFTTYSSGGIANIITGIPATTTFAGQTYNTPTYNTGIIGMTLGSAVIGSASDVIYYQAVLDCDFTSA